MNNHYIPQLLLRHFSCGNDKVNTYTYDKGEFQTKKIKRTFAEEDLLDKDLERQLAQKLEGAFGDLLNHVLLKDDGSGTVTLNRQENLLVRKFLMIQNLRAPICKCSWKELVRRTRTEDHPSVLLRELLARFAPDVEAMLRTVTPSEETYLSDLHQALVMGDVQEIADEKNGASPSLLWAAKMALAPAQAIWDCTDTDLEFIYSKLPGINQMDNQHPTYKNELVLSLLERDRAAGGHLEPIWGALLWGTCMYPENFSVHPLSPTRALVSFSPYFKAFFPQVDQKGRAICPALLPPEQFQKHFFRRTRMELFRPCENRDNSIYTYTVRQLTRREVLEINAMHLDMETEEFIFRDFNSLRESFWYYDHEVQIATRKKHDFSAIL